MSRLLSVWRDGVIASDLPLRAKAVAFVLWLHWSEGATRFPLRKEIAVWLSCSGGTVRGAIDDLQATGWLVENSVGYGHAVPQPESARVKICASPGEAVDNRKGSQQFPHSPVDKESLAENGTGDLPTGKDPLSTTTKPLPSATTSQKGKKAKRARNPIFDAVAVACGKQLASLTRTAEHEIGVAQAEIRRALTSEGIPENEWIVEIDRRARRYKRLHPTWELTPSSLKKWWPELGETHKKTAVCAECGMGGGYHTADCPLVTTDASV